MQQNPVTANQRPLNPGRWRVSGRSIMETIHVRVHAVGELHVQAACHARPSCACYLVHVATHLAMAGRGEIPGPFMVTLHNYPLQGTGMKPPALERKRWAT